MATFDTVSHLGVEYGMSFYERALAQADEGQMIHTALEAYGLTANPERTHVFTMYSPDSGKAIAVGGPACIKSRTASASPQPIPPFANLIPIPIRTLEAAYVFSI